MIVDSPNQNEDKRYYFNLSFIPDSVGVAPIAVLNGKDKFCEASFAVNYISSCTLINSSNIINVDGNYHSSSGGGGGSGGSGSGGGSGDGSNVPEINNTNINESVNNSEINESLDFSSLYFNLCATSSCEFSRNYYELNNSPIYLVANNEEGADLFARVIAPDNSTIEFDFSGLLGEKHYEEFNFNQVGEYLIEITATKEGYNDYREYIVFYVEETMRDFVSLREFENIYFKICNDSECLNPKTIFKSNEPIYILAYNYLDASLSGILINPDNKQKDIVFNGGASLVDYSFPGVYTMSGDYSAEIIAEKDKYVPEYVRINFEVVSGSVYGGPVPVIPSPIHAV